MKSNFKRNLPPDWWEISSILDAFLSKSLLPVDLDTHVPVKCQSRQRWFFDHSPKSPERVSSSLPWPACGALPPHPTSPLGAAQSSSCPILLKSYAPDSSHHSPSSAGPRVKGFREERVFHHSCKTALHVTCPMTPGRKDRVCV